MIPGWNVHDLDQLLCAMTAHLAPPVDLPVDAPESEREPGVEPALRVRRRAPSEPGPGPTAPSYVDRTPANRSSSLTSVPPMRLRASRN
jgi:hypothetical protein